ncbi:MAG TPA: hypothetical protein VFA27_02675 [Vicinamibacterales bacterium]|nr:hypothetical protein [Vicinamibacterales bacterium]
MVRTCRLVLVMLVASALVHPLDPTLLAADPPSAAAAAPLTFQGQPLAAMRPTIDDTTSSPALTRESDAPAASFGQWGYRRGRRHNDAAMTAILLGAAGAIAGTAVLVYANRPECSANPTLGGCGYGTKVVGASVLSAGVVALLVGAATWR